MIASLLGSQERYLASKTATDTSPTSTTRTETTTVVTTSVAITLESDITTTATTSTTASTTVLEVIEPANNLEIQVEEPRVEDDVTHLIETPVDTTNHDDGDEDDDADEDTDEDADEQDEESNSGLDLTQEDEDSSDAVAVEQQVDDDDDDNDAKESDTSKASTESDAEDVAAPQAAPSIFGVGSTDAVRVLSAGTNLLLVISVRLRRYLGERVKWYIESQQKQLELLQAVDLSAAPQWEKDLLMRTTSTLHTNLKSIKKHVQN